MQIAGMGPSVGPDVFVIIINWNRVAVGVRENICSFFPKERQEFRMTGENYWTHVVYTRPNANIY